MHSGFCQLRKLGGAVCNPSGKLYAVDERKIIRKLGIMDGCQQLTTNKSLNNAENGVATGTNKQPVSYAVFNEQVHSLYSGQSVAAGAAINGSKDITKSGYYPITICGWSAGGSYSGNIIIGRLYMSAKGEGTATITYNFQNGADYDLSSQSFSVRMLWMKI